jgi:hypothetical protein
VIIGVTDVAVGGPRFACVPSAGREPDYFLLPRLGRAFTDDPEVDRFEQVAWRHSATLTHATEKSSVGAQRMNHDLHGDLPLERRSNAGRIELKGVLMAEWEKQIFAINLIVSDLERSKAFYREVFDLTPLDEWEDGAIFRFGDTFIALRHDASDHSAWRAKESGRWPSRLRTWMRSALSWKSTE